MKKIAKSDLYRKMYVKALIRGDDDEADKYEQLARKQTLKEYRNHYKKIKRGHFVDARI